MQVKACRVASAMMTFGTVSIRGLAMSVSNNNSGVVAVVVIPWPNSTKEGGWGIKTNFALGSYDMEFIGSREDAEAARVERVQQFKLVS